MYIAYYNKNLYLPNNYSFRKIAYNVSYRHCDINKAGTFKTKKGIERAILNFIKIIEENHEGFPKSSLYTYNRLTPSFKNIVNPTAWTIQEVSDKKKKSIPLMYTDTDYKYEQSYTSTESKSKYIAYCIKCRHLIPKDMFRIRARIHAWGICPLCIMDIARAAQDCIDHYDPEFIEKMKTTRFIEKL